MSQEKKETMAEETLVHLVSWLSTEEGKAWCVTHRGFKNSGLSAGEFDVFIYVAVQLVNQTSHEKKKVPPCITIRKKNDTIGEIGGDTLLQNIGSFASEYLRDALPKLEGNSENGIYRTQNRNCIQAFIEKYFTGDVSSLSLNQFMSLFTSYLKRHNNSTETVTHDRRSQWNAPDYQGLLANYQKLYGGNGEEPSTSAQALLYLLLQNKQIVLKGPPGTGKTRLAFQLARQIVLEDMDPLLGETEVSGLVASQIKVIPFHPSYTYEDFVMGMEVTTEEGGKLVYQMKSRGIKEFAEFAVERENQKFVLILDEMNRAVLSSVFGELMYALEYRGKEIILSGGDTMRIPSNLYIIGTMNTADRSIAEIDYAMQRRFAFEFIKPTVPIAKELEEENKVFAFSLFVAIQGIFRKENIMTGIDPDDVGMGTSYFIYKKKLENNTWIPDGDHFKYKINYEIVPLLVEYYKDGIFRKKREMFEGKSFQYFLQDHREELRVLLEGLEDVKEPQGGSVV